MLVSLRPAIDQNAWRRPAWLARTGTIEFAFKDATALVTAATTSKTKLEQLWRYATSMGSILQRTAPGRQDCRYETILDALTTHYRASVLSCNDALSLLIPICSLSSDTCGECTYALVSYMCRSAAGCTCTTTFQITFSCPYKPFPRFLPLQFHFAFQSCAFSGFEHVQIKL